MVQKEQEAVEMAEATRQEIDEVMDGIQLRLRQAQDKLKADIALSETWPATQRVPHQAALVRTFKDHLHQIMSLDTAGQ